MAKQNVKSVRLDLRYVRRRQVPTLPSGSRQGWSDEHRVLRSRQIILLPRERRIAIRGLAKLMSLTTLSNHWAAIQSPPANEPPSLRAGSNNPREKRLSPCRTFCRKSDFALSSFRYEPPATIVVAQTFRPQCTKNDDNVQTRTARSQGSHRPRPQPLG